MCDRILRTLRRRIRKIGTVLGEMIVSAFDASWQFITVSLCVTVTLVPFALWWVTELMWFSTTILEFSRKNSW